MSGPVAQTGKQPEPNRTATANDRTSSCGGAWHSNVRLRSLRLRHVLQPVATVFSWTHFREPVIVPAPRRHRITTVVCHVVLSCALLRANLWAAAIQCCLWSSWTSWLNIELLSPATGVIADAVGVAFGADICAVVVVWVYAKMRLSHACHATTTQQRTQRSNAPDGASRPQAVCTTNRPHSGCVARAPNDDKDDDDGARHSVSSTMRGEDQATNDDDDDDASHTDDDDASHTDDTTYNHVGSLGTRRQWGALTLRRALLYSVAIALVAVSTLYLARRGIGVVGVRRHVGVVGAWHRVGIVGLRRRDSVVVAPCRIGVVGVRRRVGVVSGWHHVGIVKSQRCNSVVGAWHHVGVVGSSKVQLQELKKTATQLQLQLEATGLLVAVVPNPSLYQLQLPEMAADLQPVAVGHNRLKWDWPVVQTSFSWVWAQY
ncbi:hypothetical protein EDB84DRAFT_1442865 [Lactarius hengduanensis]|nr:hypothetical protein EDB84DRAFT_1442865 [Lactarius hengduanensis]